MWMWLGARFFAISTQNSFIQLQYLRILKNVLKICWTKMTFFQKHWMIASKKNQLVLIPLKEMAVTPQIQNKADVLWRTLKNCQKRITSIVSLLLRWQNVWKISTWKQYKSYNVLPAQVCFVTPFVKLTSVRNSLFSFQIVGKELF